MSQFELLRKKSCCMMSPGTKKKQPHTAAVDMFAAVY